MIYEITVWIDDGWSRGTVTHKVFANDPIRACELAIKHWKDNDPTNIVRIEGFKALNITEGVIC